MSAVIFWYGTDFSEFDSADIIDYILEKSESCQKKDGRGHACPSFFWHYTDKDLKVCFLVNRIIILQYSFYSFILDQLSFCNRKVCVLRGCFKLQLFFVLSLYSPFQKKRKMDSFIFPGYRSCDPSNKCNSSMTMGHRILILGFRKNQRFHFAFLLEKRVDDVFIF